jgi:hypothetical protein
MIEITDEMKRAAWDAYSKASSGALNAVIAAVAPLIEKQVREECARLCEAEQLRPGETIDGFSGRIIGRVAQPTRPSEGSTELEVAKAIFVTIGASYITPAQAYFAARMAILAMQEPKP